jgi:hypothetical protein
MRLLGIELSATEDHVSGIAQLEEDKIRTFSVYKDPDILEIVERFKPDCISINAPLHLTNKPYRNAEKEMVAMGFSPDPQNMGDMNAKTKRAINLKSQIDKIEIIECHTPSAKQILKVNDPKQLNQVRIMNILKNQQEKDAVFAALTALFYKEGNYSQFGDLEEGLIILPKLET